MLNNQHMRIQNKQFPFLFLISVFMTAIVCSTCLLTASLHAQEDGSDEPREVSVIVRNPEGDYIPRAAFTIYRQVEDVDGKPKPEKSVASGRIDPLLGRGDVSFRDQHGRYCLKIVSPESNMDFWFYGNYAFPAGNSSEVTEYLSGIQFTFRDMDNDLIKDASFTLYTQEYDIDGNPIKQKAENIGKFTNTETGQVSVYVPGSENAVDGEGADHYIFESEYNGGTYSMYDISVSEGSITQIDYRYSDMKLVLEDSQGVRFPSNTEVSLYEQELDQNNEYVLAEKIGTIETNDNGIAYFTYPEGTYAAKIQGDNNIDQVFWDLAIIDQEREVYTLTANENWRPSGGSCEAATDLTILAKDLNGEHIPNLKYALYEQTVDADGNPANGPEVLSGAVDEHGRGLETLNPDPRIDYILKVYDQNKDAGAFWYYDISFACGQDKTITKEIPAIKFILRNGEKELLKNHQFSIHTQKSDVDGNPIKKKESLIARPKTSDEGEKTVFLGFAHPYNDSKNGTYVFSSNFNGNEYTKFGVQVAADKDIEFEYIFSDIIIQAKEPDGQPISDFRIWLHEQSTNLQGEYELGKRLASEKTDSNGEVIFRHPANYYAVAMESDINNEIAFWNVRIKDRIRNYETLTPNLTRLHGPQGADKPRIDIYSMKENPQGLFFQDQKITTQRINESGHSDLHLPQGPYLFVDTHDKNDYGRALYAEQGEFQEVSLARSEGHRITEGQLFKLNQPATSRTLAEKLKGKIVLQVEQRGEAWYINPADGKRYYMKNGKTAYQMMRNFGLGITTEDLNKIPIGINERFEGNDYDADYVTDKMEEALGTDPRDSDSDGDGYNDGTEIKNDYDPLGPGKLDVDPALGNRLKGKILLQIESRGEAWYISPDDGRRYYMKDGESAYQIMRYLSLGITNDNLEKIPSGTISLD